MMCKTALKFKVHQCLLLKYHRKDCNSQKCYDAIYVGIKRLKVDFSLKIVYCNIFLFLEKAKISTWLFLPASELHLVSKNY